MSNSLETQELMKPLCEQGETGNTSRDDGDGGVTNLFAVFDIADGTVISELHRHQEFLKNIPGALTSTWCATTTERIRPMPSDADYPHPSIWPLSTVCRKIHSIPLRTCLPAVVSP